MARDWDRPFGGAVVGGQDGGQAAEQGEVVGRQPVQAEPEQGVGLVGADGEFLELVQDVAMQEPEHGPVDVQGVGPAEPGPGEQGQDGLGDAVEQGRLVRGVPVQDHRVPGQGAGQAAHGQRVRAVAVDDLQRSGQHGRRDTQRYDAIGQDALRRPRGLHAIVMRPAGFLAG